MMNKTEELDYHMHKRIHEHLGHHHHSVAAMHENIKTHDTHFNIMHGGNKKFEVKSAKELASELRE